MTEIMIVEDKSYPPEENKKESITKLDNFVNVNELIEYANILLKSKLLPPGLKTPEQVVMTIQMGKELGLGAVTAINNIHIIQGKPTLSVHAIAALLKKAGITYKIIKDFEPVYSTKEGEESKKIDMVTTIRFFQMWNNQIIENDISFKWSDAVAMGLSTKDNYKKMASLMIRSRCLAIGARFVAPEAMMGFYETTEIADVNGVAYEIDEEGNPILK